MFIIELVYEADLSEIDACMAAHVAFLKKHDAAGTSSFREETSPRGESSSPWGESRADRDIRW